MNLPSPIWLTGRPLRLFRGDWPLLRVLRPHQWLKNVLVFLPAVLAHRFHDLSTWIACVWMFAAFSAAASAVYVWNDYVDVEADRRHPTKCRRPFASGELPVTAAFPLAASLLGLAALLVLQVSWAAAGLLVGYLAATACYSYWLKRKPMVDVMVLASLYTLRLYAGSTAAGVVISEWLLMFGLFLFTSLAFAKRYAELDRLALESEGGRKGRGYEVSDLSLIETLGPASGYLAVLVYALYIHSDDVQMLYASTWALWLTCPLILYWISRMWLLAKRHKLSEDPVVFAVTDRVSLAVGGLTGLLVLLATTRF